MGSKKPKWKISPEEICRQYYESQIFGSASQNESSAQLFFADASITIEGMDNTFKSVDYITFLKEASALNIELFGLAWLNYNYEYEIYKQYSKYELLVAGEINSTKQYLINRGNKFIWDIMKFYNEVILTSYTWELSWDRWGGLRDGPFAGDVDADGLNDETKKRKIAQLESFFKAWKKYTIDNECEVRLSIRSLFVPYDTYRITRLFQNLSLELAKRIGWEPTQVGLFAIQRFVAGLHKNAVLYLDAVSESGSYEEHKKVISKQFSLLNSALNAYLAREQNK